MEKLHRQGADIQAGNVAIEVETADTVNDASRQLQGYKKSVYVAGTDKKAVEKALDKYKDTTIGVMDNQGKIVKKSTREGDSALNQEELYFQGQRDLFSSFAEFKI